MIERIKSALKDVKRFRDGTYIDKDNFILEKVNTRFKFLGSIGHSRIQKISFLNNSSAPIIAKVGEEDEYNNLVYLWDEIYQRSTVNRIPKPLFYSKSEKLLFTEFIYGKNLKLSIVPSLYKVSFQSSLNESLQLVDRAVDWLVDFESRAFNHSFLSPEEYFNSFNILISNLNYLKEDDKINLSTKFKKAIKQSEKIPVKFSNKCFRMRDILHEDKTITRVDWGNWLGRDSHPFFIELSTFLAELRELSIYPHISQRKIIKLENHFLRTYLKFLWIVHSSGYRKERLQL